jgi:WG repeat protein
MYKAPLTKLMCAALLVVTCLGTQSHAQNAAEGLLPIQQGGKWGYINRSGEVVIKPQFDSANPFADGLALVRRPPYKKPLKPGEKEPELIDGYGFIDPTGKVVIKLESPLHINGEGFSEGLTKYWTWDPALGNVYGYIDTTGKVQIKARFTVASSFVDGLAAVCIELKCGFINKSGDFVIEPKYRVTSSFSEGLALAGLEYDKVGFVNKSGEMVIEPQFANNGPRFNEGLAAVSYQQGKFGYINSEGVIVIPMQFERAQPFSDGLAAVRVDSKWGYIDKTGKFVIEPQFRGAGPFSEGLAPAGNVDFQSLTRSDEVEPATSFIDKQGKTVFSIPFDVALPFVNGISMVRVGIQMGYIDKTGKYIWQPSN